MMKYQHLKTRIKKKKEKSEEEDDNGSGAEGIDLNNFLKETLDEKMAQDPTSLDVNIQKTFQGSGIKAVKRSENETPSNNKRDKSRSRSRSRSRSNVKNKKSQIKRKKMMMKI